MVIKTLEAGLKAYLDLKSLKVNQKWKRRKCWPKKERNRIERKVEEFCVLYSRKNKEWSKWENMQNRC